MTDTRLIARLAVGLLAVLAVASASAGGLGEEAGGGRRYAMTIGVQDYGVAEARLGSALGDALAIRSFLTEAGDFRSAALFVDAGTAGSRKPSRAAILRELEATRDRSRDQAIDDVVFYFSGHGISTEDGARSYLLLGDYRQGEADARISVEDDLLPILEDIECKRMYILLDACRTDDPADLVPSDEKYSAGVGPLRISRDTAAAEEGVFVVYASRRGTPSVTTGENLGVFTQAVLDGMAVYRNYYDLFVYLDRTVPLRSFAYSSGPPQERTVQFIDFGGDFAGLSESGYASFAQLSAGGGVGSAIEDWDRTLDRREAVGKFRDAAFTVGVGVCAGSAANIALLSTLSGLYHDASIQRAQNISWSLFGGSFLLIIPAVVLYFLDF